MARRPPRGVRRRSLLRPREGSARIRSAALFETQRSHSSATRSACSVPATGRRSMTSGPRWSASQAVAVPALRSSHRHVVHSHITVTVPRKSGCDWFDTPAIVRGKTTRQRRLRNSDVTKPYAHSTVGLRQSRSATSVSRRDDAGIPDAWERIYWTMVWDRARIPAGEGRLGDDRYHRAMVPRCNTWCNDVVVASRSVIGSGAAGTSGRNRRQLRLRSRRIRGDGVCAAATGRPATRRDTTRRFGPTGTGSGLVVVTVQAGQETTLVS